MSEVLARAGQLAVGPLAGQGLDRGAALELLSLAERDLEAVLYYANRIRRRHRGDTVQLCGIVSAKSGRCSEDCRWCSQAGRHATAVQSHDLLPNEELLAAARRGAELGCSCFGFVASGARPTPAEIDRLGAVIRQVSSESPMKSCASLGLLDEAAARKLAQAGCRRYNHNLETSRRHYGHLVTTHSYDQRLATVRAVKAAGLELCCGGIFGMGETDEDRVDLALEIRGAGADMVPVNFLNPVPGTPLEHVAPLGPRKCLALLAMVRFVLPTVGIKVSGGREVNLRDLQSWIFMAGADGCVAGNYLTTAGRPAADDLRMIADLGLRVAGGAGGGER